VFASQSRAHRCHQRIAAHFGEVTAPKCERIDASAGRAAHDDRLGARRAQCNDGRLGARRIDGIDHHLGCWVHLRIGLIGLEKRIDRNHPRVGRDVGDSRGHHRHLGRITIVLLLVGRHFRLADLFRRMNTLPSARKPLNRP
jgi:hypothetical protein